MKDFLTFAKKRKSVFEFNNKKVKKLYINKILEAGRFAPSAMNAQPWKFIVVKDRDKINKLVNVSFCGFFHVNPPLLIVLVIEKKEYDENIRGVINGKTGLVEAYLSISTAGMNMVYEAEDLNINSCFLTPNEDQAIKVLGLKKGDKVPLMIGFGYEKENSFVRKKERKELKDIVIYEG